MNDMRPKTIAAFAAAILIALSPPASAQEQDYTRSDDEIMQNCFEAVRDMAADPDSEQNLTLRDCIGQASSACQDETLESSTTWGMMQCAGREQAWWDDYLNTTYQNLRDLLDDEEFDMLRKAQRAWLDFRDAQCAFDYFFWREGTIRTIFGASCQMSMTAERALDLNEIVEWHQL